MRMSVPQTGVLARDRAREQISIDTDHCDGPQPSHRQVAKIGMHRHAAVPLGLMRGTPYLGMRYPTHDPDNHDVSSEHVY